jgi:uncharacterized protein (TIGR00730 family)
MILLTLMKNRVVVFAGNSCLEKNEKKYYSVAYETGKLLAENKYVTVTGGGPGLMNETLKGSYENGGETISVQLQIKGTNHSKYYNKKFSFIKLKNRQAKLFELADAFIALPGGIGTFYEVFEVLALKRKKEITSKAPLILIGKYFEKFREIINTMKSEGFIYFETDNLFNIVNTPSEAIMILKKYDL